MIVTEEFVKRIETLLSYFTLSTSAFADRIGVQRSAISHLLSGRNKPSLDFVLKIQAAFPEVNLYWLLLGTGSPISEDGETTSPTEDVKKAAVKKNIASSKHNDAIDKIIVFYSDGTFSEYFTRG